MTITRLNKFLQDKCQHCFVQYPLENFSPNKIAIDTMIYMYQCKNQACEKVINSSEFSVIDGKLELPDEKLIVQEYLKKIANFAIKLKNSGVNPVFVLDGKRHILKSAKHKKTMEEVAQRNIYIEELRCKTRIMTEQLKSLIKYNAYPTKSDRKITASLLVAMGFEVKFAENEAEALCAYLCKTQYCIATLTEDGDIYPNGCPFSLRKLKKQNIKEMGFYNDNKIIVSAIAHEDILKELDLTDEEFVTMCVMSGTDFNTNVYNYGIYKIYSLVKKYHTFQALCDTNPIFKQINFQPVYDFFITDAIEQKPPYPLLSKTELISLYKLDPSLFT